MLSAFTKGSHQPFSLRKMPPHKTIWWLLGMAAIIWDSASISAKLFLSRCISSPWWLAASPQYFIDHVSAYPITAAWMVSRCAAFKYKTTTIQFLTKIALMLAAMVPACAVAAQIAPLVPPIAQTITYGLIMILSCELIMHAVVRCGTQTKTKCAPAQNC